MAHGSASLSPTGRDVLFSRRRGARFTGTQPQPPMLTLQDSLIPSFLARCLSESFSGTKRIRSQSILQIPGTIDVLVALKESPESLVDTWNNGVREELQ